MILDLGGVTTKEHSTFFTSLEVEPHHQIKFRVTLGIKRSRRIDKDGTLHIPQISGIRGYSLGESYYSVSDVFCSSSRLGQGCLMSNLVHTHILNKHDFSRNFKNEPELFFPHGKMVSSISV